MNAETPTVWSLLWFNGPKSTFGNWHNSKYLFISQKKKKKVLSNSKSYEPDKSN